MKAVLKPWRWPLWLRRLLDLHSPSQEMIGRCWCQK